VVGLTVGTCSLEGCDGRRANWTTGRLEPKRDQSRRRVQLMERPMERGGVTERSGDAATEAGADLPR
jgi:hypothetical protein